MTVKARCENMAVVAAIKSGSCKERKSMHLRRCLAFMEASVPFILVAEHIRGEDNVVADALSRNSLTLACSVMQAEKEDGVRIRRGCYPYSIDGERSWSEQEWSELLDFSSAKD